VPSFLVLEEEPLRPDMFLLGAVLALVALGTFGYLLTHGGNRVRFSAVTNEPMRSAMAPAVDGSGVQERVVPKEGDKPDPVPVVSAEERELVIRTIVDAVQKYDPDRAEARGVAELLERQDNLGAYDGIRSGPLFAGVLTRDINGATRQLTVTVMCGQEPLPGSSIWVKPSHRGARAWLRIDDHFSVALEPVRAGNRE
jgi:hypothetical protein